MSEADKKLAEKLRHVLSLAEITTDAKRNREEVQKELKKRQKENTKKVD